MVSPVDEDGERKTQLGAWRTRWWTIVQWALSDDGFLWQQQRVTTEANTFPLSENKNVISVVPANRIDVVRTYYYLHITVRWGACIVFCQRTVGCSIFSCSFEKWMVVVIITSRHHAQAHSTQHTMVITTIYQHIIPNGAQHTRLSG